MLRWNAQHGSLNSSSVTDFHPATVSGTPWCATSSCASVHLEELTAVMDQMNPGWAKAGSG